MTRTSRPSIYTNEQARSYRARERATEQAALDRMHNRIHELTADDLRAIVGDNYAGIAREIADQEMTRRARLSAHERMAEAAAQGRLEA